MRAISSPSAGAVAPTSTALKQSADSLKMDWIIFVLPTALAVTSTLGGRIILLALALLLVAAFARSTRPTQSGQFGPLLLLVASAAIVFSRPEAKSGALIGVLIFAVVLLLVFQVVMTVDARIVIASLIDGAGIYLVVNVLGYFVGMRSGGAGDRIGAVTESSGFTRIIFPFSPSLDEPPTIAAIYICAVLFLIVNQRGMRRWFRLTCLVAAFLVAWSGATRAALLTALLVPIVLLIIPRVIRWIAPATTVFASLSALLLPGLISAGQSIITPLVVLIAPQRDLYRGAVSSLNGRDLIWNKSLNFWSEHVSSVFHQVVGFGQGGQYRSGASMSYANILSGAVRNPLRASTHNSFLQQLFDGGLLGWLLLTLAVFWASVRLSRRVSEWGPQGRAAISAMSALLIMSSVQVTLSPGFFQQGFVLLMVFVGVACQSPDGERLRSAKRTTGQPRSKGLIRPATC